MKSMGKTQEEYYRGVRMAPYDLVKELVLALAGFGVLAILISVLLSSPDVAPVTIAAWSQADPVDFVTTATGELAGATTSAGYGAPYNTTPDAYQHWGPIAPQAWFGVRIPVDSANAFVIDPLKRASFSNATLGASLSQWQAATPDQQAAARIVAFEALRTLRDRATSAPDATESDLRTITQWMTGSATTSG